MIAAFSMCVFSFYVYEYIIDFKLNAIIIPTRGKKRAVMKRSALRDVCLTHHRFGLEVPQRTNIGLSEVIVIMNLLPSRRVTGVNVANTTEGGGIKAT